MNLHYIAAACVSNIQLPSREEPLLDLDEHSNFTDTSSSDTRSLVSEDSTDPFVSGCAIGNCDDDDDDDDEGVSEISIDNDDNSNGFQELDFYEGEAAAFVGGPCQGLDVSAEEQLHSLRSGKNERSIRSFFVFSIIILSLDGFGSISR